MNLTMATSALFGKRGEGVLSVGRVQTPTLKLIVDRDREIEKFTPSDYFELFAHLSDENIEFKAKWICPEDLCDESGHCLKREIVEEAKSSALLGPSIVRRFDDKHKKTQAPLCFSLSALQKIASSKFGFGAKKTLEVAQALYEKHKATTYPRSDCGYLPISQFGDAKSILSVLSTIDPDVSELITQCDPSFKSSAWNDKKVTAHHGIIPTNNAKVNLGNMSVDERKIYELIKHYYIAQFLGEYTYTQRTVEVDCGGEIFKAKGILPIEMGWKRAIKEKSTDANIAVLPIMESGQELSLLDCTVESKKTKPPSRFTEGTLIAAMKNIAKMVDDQQDKKQLKESSGIGTEATRANIIEVIQKRDYVKTVKKQLVSTEKGRNLIDLLPDLICDPATTAKWEHALDAIAQGSGETSALDGFIDNQKSTLNEMLNLLSLRKESQPVSSTEVHKEEAAHPCPACEKGQMSRRKGKYGYFWGCSRYPECNHIMADAKGTPVAKKKAIPVEKSDISCTKCKKGHLVRRPSKRGGHWWGCDSFPKCKSTYEDKNGSPVLEWVINIPGLE
jgi:DNA topoisomerase-3